MNEKYPVKAARTDGRTWDVYKYENTPTEAYKTAEVLMQTYRSMFSGRHDMQHVVDFQWRLLQEAKQVATGTRDDDRPPRIHDSSDAGTMQALSQFFK